MSPLSSIQIKIAETDAEKEAAYRLRYEIFDLEEGDHRYSDHERKFWIDQDDGQNCTVLIALNQGRCIGTTRFTLLSNQRFIGLEAYRLDVLAPLLGMTLEKLHEVVGRWDRGVVEKQSRGCGLLQHMEEQLVRIAREQGCRVIVGVIEAGNDAMVRIVHKSGYQPLPAIGTYQGFTGQLIYKDLRSPPLTSCETSRK